MQEVVVLSGAESDLLAIYAHHLALSEDEAARFAARLDYRLNQLRDFPELGPPFHTPYRRLVLGKFPYSIFYSVTGTRVFVQAILNLRTDRAAIRQRLGLS